MREYLDETYTTFSILRKLFLSAAVVFLVTNDTPNFNVGVANAEICELAGAAFEPPRTQWLHFMFNAVFLEPSINLVFPPRLYEMSIRASAVSAKPASAQRDSGSTKALCDSRACNAISVSDC